MCFIHTKDTVLNSLLPRPFDSVIKNMQSAILYMVYICIYDSVYDVVYYSYSWSVVNLEVTGSYRAYSCTHIRMSLSIVIRLNPR